MQAAATQVTLVTATLPKTDGKAAHAATSTTVQQTSTSSSGSSTTDPTTIFTAVGSTLQAGASPTTDPKNFTSTSDIHGPGHISAQATTESPASWSTTAIVSQQAVDTVTTTTETIVAATATAAIGTTDGKSRNRAATDDATTDVGSTTDAAQTSSATTTPQPPTSSSTPTVVAGNPTQTNSSAGNATSGSEQDNSTGNGIDRVRFVQRVARAFQSVGSSGGSIRLRLSPPELGSVKLEVTVKDGVLTAHAQTETAAARDAMVDNLPALRERLAEQNIQVDQFDVDLFDSSAGGTPNQSQGNGDSPQGFASTASRSTSKSSRGVTASVTSATDQAAGIVNGGLNVVI